MLIFVALGREWFDKHVYDSANPDPWMLNGTRDWFASHPVPPPDLRPIIHASRVTRLGDALFTVISNVRDSEKLKDRFLKRGDTRANFTETEIASLLAWNGCSVRIVGESGTRGQDFDLAATSQGVEVSVEVTAMNSNNLTVGAVYNKLLGKRTQVRSDRPGVLFVHIPESAMRNRPMAELIIGAGTRQFFLRSRRYHVVVFVWETFRMSADGAAEAGMRFQPVYNNNARLKVPDHTVFSVERDRWGFARNSKSLLGTLWTYRMRQNQES